jgi:hypothetical protein
MSPNAKELVAMSVAYREATGKPPPQPPPADGAFRGEGVSLSGSVIALAPHLRTLLQVSQGSEQSCL